MGYEAVILKDSINTMNRRRITTWRWTYPRMIHGEVMTYRVFSRNAASSRAIPIHKFIRQVLRDPATPVWWGAGQSGMQARAELSGWRLWLSKRLWYGARYPAVGIAWVLDKLGLHKQLTNRILEPWMWMTIVVTMTELDNFWLQRDHPDAQPEIQHLARLARKAYAESVPAELSPGQWHIPLVSGDELLLPVVEQLKVSTGRCAGISYLRLDETRPVGKEVALHDRLCGSTPKHMSPFEHQAEAMLVDEFFGPTRGWRQYRKTIPDESGAAA